MGGVVSYQQENRKHTLTNKNDHLDVLSGYRILNTVLVMPTFEFKYMRKGIVELYGNVDAGMAFYNYQERVPDGGKENFKSTWTPSFAMQINPIGIRVGKKVAGFAEFGVGFRGFGTVGLSVRL